MLTAVTLPVIHAGHRTLVLKDLDKNLPKETESCPGPGSKGQGAGVAVDDSVMDNFNVELVKRFTEVLDLILEPLLGLGGYREDVEGGSPI